MERNCVLLLNVSPNTMGLISEEDAERLMEFTKAIKTIFSKDLVAFPYVTKNSVRGEAFIPSNVLNNDLWTYWAPKNHKNNKKNKLDMFG